MSICKEKPASLPPLDAIGLEPLDSSSLHIARGGSGHHRTSSAALPPACQAPIGLGLSSSSLSKGASSSFHPMGNFATAGASKLSSEDRFAASSRAVSVGGAGMLFPPPMGLTRTASMVGLVGRLVSVHVASGARSGMKATRLGTLGRAKLCLCITNTLLDLNLLLLFKLLPIGGIGRHSRLTQTHPRWLIGRSRVC